MAINLEAAFDRAMMDTLGFAMAMLIGAVHLFSRKGRIKGDLAPYPDDFLLGEAYSREPLAKLDSDSPRVLMRREPGIK